MAREAMVALLAVTLSGGWAFAANPPFGGDDTGFIPPPKSPVQKCETVIAKRVGKLVASFTKCHAARVAGKLANDAAEDACEQKAAAKFNATPTTGCGPCTNLTGIESSFGAFIDSGTADVFCGPGTPMGGDDPGNVPVDSPTGTVTRCELGINKAVTKLAKKLLACHVLRASGKLASDAAEDSCESSAKSAFVTKTSTSGCPPCINLTTLANKIEAGFDSRNGKVYCASPSSAFFTSGRGWLGSLF